MYTHRIFEEFLENDEEMKKLNWIFCSLSLVSILMTLVGGLLFLRFAYVLNIAHKKKSLFESGLLVEEESEN